MGNRAGGVTRECNNEWISNHWQPDEDDPVPLSRTSGVGEGAPCISVMAVGRAGGINPKKRLYNHEVDGNYLVLLVRVLAD
jgi:hypothetical protein